MKYLVTALLFSSIFLAGYTTLLKKHTPPKIDQEALEQVLQKKALTTIRCTPDWKTYHLTQEEIQQMIPLPGTGDHTWKISSTNDSAQFYFNQGINLYYGFHIIEALPSFKKAQTFDTNCAMLYWGEALAYGPNINDFGYAASPDALVATKKAKEFSNNSFLKEKVLIEAMQVRYSPDSTQKREYLNEHYADKMKEVYAEFPADAEIGTLYADALMIQHPWDLWQHNGQPKPWTPEIERVLENVLKHSPDHPGANHYYIHIVEASPFPWKANASAERLGKLSPGLSHMVHMPSHIYIRTGKYAKGIEVNKNSVATYNNYLQLYPEVVNNAALYEIHNRHMKAACAINLPDYPTTLQAAIECKNSFDTSFLSMEAPIGTFMQYVYMMPEIAMITFKKWHEILMQPQLNDKYHYAALLQLFARGLAYANTHQILKAKTSLTSLESMLKEKDMYVILIPFNAPATGGTVAKYLLRGAIAENENNFTDAIINYKIAVATQDSLIYNEPRDWLIPARHFLGNALLRVKKYKDAAIVFRENLKAEPGNYVGIKGLQNALTKRKKN